jgi:hypothetical protein
VRTSARSKTAATGTDADTFSLAFALRVVEGTLLVVLGSLTTVSDVRTAATGTDSDALSLALASRSALLAFALRVFEVEGLLLDSLTTVGNVLVVLVVGMALTVAPLEGASVVVSGTEGVLALGVLAVVAAVVVAVVVVVVVAVVVVGVRVVVGAVVVVAVVVVVVDFGMLLEVDKISLAALEARCSRARLMAAASSGGTTPSPSFPHAVDTHTSSSLVNSAQCGTSAAASNPTRESTHPFVNCGTSTKKRLRVAGCRKHFFSSAYASTASTVSILGVFVGRWGAQRMRSSLHSSSCARLISATSRV